MLNEFLSTLNEKQLEAVHRPLCPVLVLAGPGTGKTRLLIARIVYLIENFAIKPENILALTFTNKAAAEMEHRLLNFLGQRGNEVNTGTFHSFALQLIRKYHARLGLNKFFSVCDQEYQESLLYSLCAPFIRDNLDNKVKGMLLSFSNHHTKNKSLSHFANERFKDYRKHLAKHNLIDFDQIILFCMNLLRDHKDILNEYQYLFPAIVVDEFQDTDPLQYEILKMLAEENKNIFIVADDDQSIYSWRGANPENIKQFLNDFSIKAPVFLDINYRSGYNILRSASKIIEDTDRIEPNKLIRVDESFEDKIEIQLFLNEKDEVDFILKKIEDWENSGIDYSDIAIIYPFHKIGHSLEDFIVKKQIPYQMAEGRSIFNNPLINKVILYLQLIRDLDDHVALAELTSLELGQSLCNFIKQHAREKSIPFRKALYEFYNNDDERLNFDTNLKIKDFIANIANLVNLKNFYSFSKYIEEIYSAADQQKSSFLAKNIKSLQSLNLIEKNFGMRKDELKNKNIAVYHSDKELSFLAKIFLESVFKRKVKLISTDMKSEIQPKEILIELSPYSEKIASQNRIPVYELGNERRKGSMSNLFKFLQCYTLLNDKNIFDRFIVLDLETTGKDANNCGIVELAAVRVEKGLISAELQTFINPEQKISEEAQQVHGISEKDIKDAPAIEDFWNEFKSFIGDDIIIAHNGYNFDFIILDRFAKKIDGNKLSNVRFDTLALARNLFPEKLNSIDALMDRFQLKCESRHRALDDVRVLIQIFEKLQTFRSEISKRTSLEMFLDIVSLGNYLENKLSATEDRLFFIGGARKLLTAYSTIRTKYTKEFSIDDNQLKVSIKEKLFQIQPNVQNYHGDEHLLVKIKSMAAQYDNISIDEAMANFLSYISLNTSQDQLENINAISLLTFHAAKGLEFDKVILMGMEKNNMPGFHALREDLDDDRPISKKIEEQRRLFYVGMTRAKTELILTAVKNRGGWEHESSPFLKDLKIPSKINSNE